MKKRKSPISHWFTQFASRTSEIVGSHWAFGLAVVVILAWAVTGPVFDFSPDWQLAVNTGTTIVTFLMVFLIQNTQNRDAEALHIKLDEIIRAIAQAENVMIGIEHKDKEELDRERARIERFIREPDDPRAQREAVRHAVGGKRAG